MMSGKILKELKMSPTIEINRLKKEVESLKLRCEIIKIQNEFTRGDKPSLGNLSALICAFCNIKPEDLFNAELTSQKHTIPRHLLMWFAVKYFKYKPQFVAQIFGFKSCNVDYGVKQVEYDPVKNRHRKEILKMLSE